MKLRFLVFMALPVLAATVWMISYRISPVVPAAESSAPELPGSHSTPSEASSATGVPASNLADPGKTASGKPHNQKAAGPPDWITSQIKSIDDIFRREGDPGKRWQILRKACSASRDGGFIAGAREIVESLRMRITEPALQQEIDEFVAGLKKDEAKRGPVDVAVAEKSIEETRLRGQLEHMKGELARARNLKKPVQDLQSLERMVFSLEEQLAAHRKQ